MKKLTYTLTILLISIQFTHAQFWEQVTIPDTAQVRCLDINQNGTIFIGSGEHSSINGGVYHSNDNGETWLFSELTGLWITVYAIYASDDNQTVFACASNQIYRTQDNGDSWSVIFDNTANFLSIFESSDNILYAGSWSGGYKTLNNGEDWIEFLTFNYMEVIYDFAETSNGYLYAANWNFENYLENGVYRSIDGGDNWEFIDIADDGFTALAVNSNDEIFAASFYEGLFISDDYGDTWIQKPGYTINDLFIDNNDVLYVATENFGVLRSFDKGDNWEDISSGLYSSNFDQFALSPDGYLYCIPGLYRSIEPVTKIQEYKKNKVNIYPNPSNGIFTVSNVSNLISDITITDITGKQIYTSTMHSASGNRLEINLSKQANGIYFIKLNNKEETIIKKIIVAH